MAISIPPDAKVVQDSRLNLIRIIASLFDRYVDPESPDSIKSKVKQTLQDKGARYAESSHVIADLRPGGVRSPVDKRALYKLVEAGELKTSAFLDCISGISKDKLKAHLSGKQIEKLCVAGGEASAALFTEFKDGADVDLEYFASALSKAISNVPITGAGKGKAA